MGGLIPYGKIWRTGASDATILTIADPLTIAGKPLPAGSYSLFTIPNRGEWTVILNKHVGGHGLDGYDKKTMHCGLLSRPIRRSGSISRLPLRCRI